LPVAVLIAMDIEEVQDFNVMYELYKPCTVMSSSGITSTYVDCTVISGASSPTSWRWCTREPAQGAASLH
jgi:hypothetical protein